MMLVLVRVGAVLLQVLPELTQARFVTVTVTSRT